MTISKIDKRLTIGILFVSFFELFTKYHNKFQFIYILARCNPAILYDPSSFSF